MHFLLYKWGRPIVAFDAAKGQRFYYDISHGDSLEGEQLLEDSHIQESVQNIKNGGRGCDFDLEAYAVQLAARGHVVDICMTPKFLRYTEGKYIEKLHFKDKPQDSNASIIIIFAGPENEEFNKDMIEHLNSHKDKKIYVISSDRRFYFLQGVNVPYTILSELEIAKTLEGHTIEPFTASTRLLVDTYLRTSKKQHQKVLIIANENHQDFEHSRAHRICLYCDKNPELHFVLMGRWEEHARTIHEFRKRQNLDFRNDQMDYYDMHDFIRQFNYALIIQECWHADNPYDEQIGFPINSIPMKFYEYGFNRVLPFIDCYGFIDRIDANNLVYPDYCMMYEPSQLTERLRDLQTNYTAWMRAWTHLNKTLYVDDCPFQDIMKRSIT